MSLCEDVDCWAVRVRLGTIKNAARLAAFLILIKFARRLV